MTHYRRPKNKQPSLFEQSAGYEVKSIPDFVSTPEEIKKAVERNAIHRGALLIQIIASLKIRLNFQ